MTKLNIKISSEDFWNSIKDNIVTYLDIVVWQEIFSNDFKAQINDEDKEFLKLAAELLPDLLDLDNFKLWIKNLSTQANRKGKDLYHPLRIALTNKENGPELSKIVPLLGYEIVKQRLLGR